MTRRWTRLIRAADIEADVPVRATTRRRSLRCTRNAALITPSHPQAQNVLKSGESAEAAADYLAGTGAAGGGARRRHSGARRGGDIRFPEHPHERRGRRGVQREPGRSA